MSAAKPPPEAVALILAGGRGLRLWPLSTPARPKPFRALFGAEPLVTRVARQAAAWTGDRATVWISLGESQVAAARQAIPDLDAHTLLREERPGETTVAIARAAIAIAARRPDTVILVLAADQRLAPDDAVLRAFDRAAAVARGGPRLVSLGMRPDGPRTAYGYMPLGAPIAGVEGAFEGLGYVEKPDAETAARLLAEGPCLWNAGIFAFRAEVLLAALGRHAPEAMNALSAGEVASRPLRAIDYELMERVRPGDPEQHAFVEARHAISDCGNLAALAAEAPSDARGNRIRGDVSVAESDDCVLLCEAPRRLKVEGLSSYLVAVGAEGNLLVSPRATGNIEFRVCVEEEEVAAQAAEQVIDVLRKAIARRGRAVLVPSTGRTVVRCYALLADHHRRAIDWDRVEVFQMDEMSDLPEALTARAFLQTHLLDPLGIRRARFFHGTDPSSAEARSLERALVAAGPDLVIHGLGENGHLGLNEPGSSFDAEARAVALSEDTRRSKRGQFGGLEPPLRGVTLGLGALLDAPRSLLLATGDHKRTALRRALFGPISRDVPASGVRLRGRVTVIADRAALPDWPSPRASIRVW